MNVWWAAAALVLLEGAAVLYAIYLTEPHRGHCLYGVMDSWECAQGRLPVSRFTRPRDTAY